MKKTSFIMALALPALLLGTSGNVNAKADHAKKEAAIEQNMNEKIKDSAEKVKHEKKDHKEKKHNKDKKHDKGGKKHSDERVKDELTEVEKDYQKALKKIDESSFDGKQKDLLRRQAKENMELEKKHIQERADMMKKHHKERQNDENFHKAAKADKANHKAVKKVRDILD